MTSYNDDAMRIGGLRSLAPARRVRRHSVSRRLILDG
jgi:hypothetical protein